MIFSKDSVMILALSFRPTATDKFGIPKGMIVSNVLSPVPNLKGGNVNWKICRKV